MEYIELALLVVGVAVLVIGYRKNHRNVLLSAAIILFLAGAIGDITHGFLDGFRAGVFSAGATK